MSCDTKTLLTPRNLRVFSQKLPSAGYSVVKERKTPAFAAFGSFGAAGFDGNLRNLVENTGLEPVTSWLQTRRSPS